MTRILAYLGPAGTFSSHAAQQYLQRPAASPLSLQSFPTIPAIFQALLANEVDLALVPAENSIEGSVTATMDLLAQDIPLYIQVELVIPIVHNLLSRATCLSAVRKVLSHPQAIAQCRSFLAKELSHAQLVETNSTAEAARLVAEGNSTLAAISSLECAERYLLTPLASGIADYSNNETRFLLVGQEQINSSVSSKTSMVIALERDHPGGLYQVLGLFARENINLSRIESRPSKLELGKYIFFIDCEAGYAHPGLQRVLAELAKFTVYLRNLGSYTQL